MQKRLTFSLIRELLAVASIHCLHAEMHEFTKGKGEGTHPSNSQTGHRGRDCTAEEHRKLETLSVCLLIQEGAIIRTY